jgi:hypothetical protein
MTDFDAERVRNTIDAALGGPGGIALVINVFARLPGVTHTPAKSGIFRSQPARLQIGDWRYEVTDDARLRAAHIVNGIVIADEVLLAHAVGPHIARSLGQLAARYGAGIVPNIQAAVDALEASAG